MSDMKKALPQLVAHRGIMAHYPENSLEGMEAALRLRTPYVEFDIQCTADRRLVLYHDPSLRRTSGVDGEIFDYRFAQLSNFGAGEAERFGDRFSGVRIPLLSQLVELAHEYPDSRLLAEIKIECIARFGLKPVMERLFLELMPIRKRCIIISFHFPALLYIREQRVHYRCGWVLDAYGANQQQRAKQLRPELLIGNRDLLTPTTQLWPGPWQWMVYEVNDPAQALAYTAAGIQLVETADAMSMLRDPLLTG
jgi:glycerophosphoryl diester phosphodiesterase